MSPALTSLAPKLAPVIARLGSGFDGERLACIAAMERLLAREGLTFTDLADLIGSTARSAPAERREDDHDHAGEMIEALLGEWRIFMAPSQQQFVSGCAEHRRRFGHLRVVSHRVV